MTMWGRRWMIGAQRSSGGVTYRIFRKQSVTSQVDGDNARSFAKRASARGGLAKGGNSLQMHVQDP
jgi:hypothetical protein